MTVTDEQDILVKPGEAAVFQLDLGGDAIAVDLTDPDWASHVAAALDELGPPIAGQASTAIDSAHVHAFVVARTTELVAKGAMSLVLLRTGSDVAPVAVGAVFLGPVVGSALAQWASALGAEGWVLSAIEEQVIHAGARSGVVIRARRCVSIPGVAGLALSEHLAVVDTDSGSITVLFQGATTQAGNDLSDSAILDVLNSAGLKKT